MVATTAAIDAEHQGTPHHWRLVIVLLAIYTYAFVDRMIFALLVEPIKAGLGASDVQISLLLGLAFAVCYGLFGIPAGHFVDRISRRRLVAIASVAWASMTIVCGMATTLPLLFLGRMGIGATEAFLTPAAFSMIRDAVPGRSRGLAFSIYAMAPMFGGATALIGGAQVLRLAEAGGFAGIPVFGAIAPWQVTLLAAGLCGLPLSLLLLFVAEPQRSSQSVAAAGAHTNMRANFLVAVHYMKDRAALFVPLLIFGAFGAMMPLAVGSWMPAAFGRKWGLAPHDVGPIVGALSIGGGLPGLLFGGVILNAMTRRGGNIQTYGVIAALLSAVGIVGAMVAPNIVVSYVGVFICAFFMGNSYTVGATTLSALTPPLLMGRISAIYLMVQNLVAQVFGPLIVALVAEHIFSGPQALPNGLMVSVVCFAVVAIVSAYMLGRATRRSAEIS